MRVAQKFAGYSLADADNLRKACLPAGSRVLTRSRGYVPIESVMRLADRRDQTIDADSATTRFEAVDDVWSVGVKPVYRLTTSTGEFVEPAIKIPAGVKESDLAIGRDGTVSAGSKALGRLRIVEVPSPGQLTAAENNTFTTNAMSGAPGKARSTTVLGGALEGSNTDLASAMVQMIESQRAFQLASRAIKMQDDAWSIANQLKQR